MKTSGFEIRPIKPFGKKLESLTKFVLTVGLLFSFVGLEYLRVRT